MTRTMNIASAVAAIALATCTGVAAQTAAPVAEAASLPASAASGVSLARPAMLDANDPSCRPERPGGAQPSSAAGPTKVRFRIDGDGKLLSAEILKSSGPSREHRMLDIAAMQALARCPFRPGRDEAGRPVGTSIVVDYQW